MWILQIAGCLQKVREGVEMIEALKASAGAGKTHRLTGEYIELLFSKDYAFKNILAVTFTNKATEEMKSRIVKELNKRAKEKGDKEALEYLKTRPEWNKKDLQKMITDLSAPIAV